MAIKNIEEFFLNIFLRICILGVLLVFMTDALLYPADRTSLVLDAIILTAALTAYFIRSKFPTIAILTLSTITLFAMLYQTLAIPVNGTTSLSVILIVGFIYSVMLKGRLMWIMHAIAFCAIHARLIWLYFNDELPGGGGGNETLTVAITYTILYFVLTYSAAVLKASYDKMNAELRQANDELHEKADEIEAQNEELRQAQDNLNMLNSDLERIVDDRTQQIQYQNEMLIKFSYANAHHLRGPVARMMGLASIYKMDPQLNSDFVMSKMLDQANEIDLVIRQISVELESTIGKRD